MSMSKVCPRDAFATEARRSVQHQADAAAASRAIPAGPAQLPSSS